MHRKLCIGLIVLLMLFSTQGVQAVDQESGDEIVLNIPSHQLCFKSNGTVVKVFPVAVGRPAKPTPVGLYHVLSKVVNPVWYPSGRQPVPSGPNNPLGYRWIGFLTPKNGSGAYGIHGTSQPNSIGNSVSSGCVRMHNQDVEQLFKLVKVGTPVRITYERVVIVQTGSTCTVRVFPDVYKRQSLNVASLRGLLADNGITITNLDSRLSALIKGSGSLSFAMKNDGLVSLQPTTPKGSTVPVVASVPAVPAATPQKKAPYPISVSVNGTPLDISGYATDEEVYIPVRRLSESLGFTLVWDPNGTVKLNGQLISVRKEDGVSYIPLTILGQMPTLKIEQADDRTSVQVNQERVEYLGRIISRIVLHENDLVYIRASDLATALDMDIEEDLDSATVTVDNLTVCGLNHDSEVFIPVTVVGDLFGAEVIEDSSRLVWSIQGKTTD